MTPNLIILYVAAVALIGLLAMFARQNKKSGWVKPRSTVVEDLRRLQASWDEADQRMARSHAAAVQTGQTPVAAMPQPQAAMASHATQPSEVAALNTAAAFTFQLFNLQIALRKVGPPVIVAETPAALEPEAALERVAK